MLELKIGEKDYKIEYTIEATLCDECVEKITDLMCKSVAAEDTTVIKAIVNSISSIPSTALSMFYAGLLEHHGENGDNTVTSKKKAKELLKQYMEENKDNDEGNFYSLITILINEMAENDFFKLIGLEKMITNIQANEEVKKPKKQPQDHKPKQTTKATKN